MSLPQIENSKSDEISRNALSRQAKHTAAVQLFRNEQYSDALATLQQAALDHGNHLGLLCDLANCHFMLGHFDQWLCLVNTIECELNENFDIISAKTKYFTLINLGKFFEETGNIKKALQSYEKALEHAAQQNRWSVLCQLLRVKAFYGVRTGLGELYKQLLVREFSNSKINEASEVQHALMLTEFRLIGQEVARQRLNRVYDLLSLEDQRLFLFDFLELSLLHKVAINDEEKSKLAIIRRQNQYESLISTLTMGNRPSDFDPFDYLIAQRVSPAAYIRMLALCEGANLQTSCNIELRKQLLLLLDGFSPDSRRIWRAYLGLKMRPEQQSHSVFLLEDDGITFNTNKVSYSPNSNAMKFMRLMVGKLKVSENEIASSVFDVNPNLDHYDRIRMFISRLNRDLSKLNGVEKNILYFDRKAALAPCVKIGLI